MREGNYAILLFSVTEVSQASHLQEEDITPLYDMLRTGRDTPQSIRKIMKNPEYPPCLQMFYMITYTNHKRK